MKIGTSITDITPPLQAGILMSSVKGQYEPFKSVRLPLKCRVLAIEYEGELLAIASLDLLGLSHTAVSGWNRFKCAIEGPIKADNIIITCTHTHSSPESAGVTDLYRTDVFKQWLSDLETCIKYGINAAIGNLKYVTISVGSSTLQGYSLQRRVRLNGKMILSDSVQPIVPDLFKKGPIDRRVRALKFASSSGDIVATLGHALCHPVHEMCSACVSPDFPGEFCLSLEASGKVGMPLFVNGGCGDINPPTVSEGAACAHAHGMALAESVSKATYVKVMDTPVRLLSKNISVGIRRGSGITDENNSIIRLNVLQLGNIVLVFIPGEPFTATALQIEDESPFAITIVVGYAENYVGYIPTKNVFKEGGYETGPGRWSYLEDNTEVKIRAEIKKMLMQMYFEGDVE